MCMCVVLQPICGVFIKSNNDRSSPISQNVVAIFERLSLHY